MELIVEILIECLLGCKILNYSVDVGYLQTTANSPRSKIAYESQSSYVHCQTTAQCELDMTTEVLFAHSQNLTSRDSITGT